MKKRILAVFAHPDDEAFGVGGTLARYAAEGHDVELVSATRGEAGEIADSKLATVETLGEVREKELRCAAQTLGVKKVHFLDFCDSGMDGTELNRSAISFVNADPAQVQMKLIEIMREFKPDAVITFEPNGGYGHPDHIAIHHHTVSAFHAAAASDMLPGLGEAHQAERLFFTAIPRSFFVELREQIHQAGLDASDYDWLDQEHLAEWESQINVEIEVSTFVETKWQALKCHATQFGPENLFRRLPEEEMRKLIGREFFSLAWPPAQTEARFTDLFAKIAG